MVAAPAITPPWQDIVQDEPPHLDRSQEATSEPEHSPAAETPTLETAQVIPDAAVILPEPHSPNDPPQSPGLPAETPTTPTHLAFQNTTPLAPLQAAELAALYGSNAPREAKPDRLKPRRPRGKRVATVAALIAIAAVAGVGFVVLPKMLAAPETIQAQFTAPMLVLRAVASGAVRTVAVTVGQAVEPKTVLLTIRTDTQTDPTLTDLQSRLSSAQVRLGRVSDAPSDGRQRDAATAEVNSLQKAVSSTDDRPVVAGVRGVVWSLDTQTGLHLEAGDPLIQLADCGRAFMVVRDAASHFKAGQTVLITMPSLRPFHGTVRASSGVAEPPNTLVIDPTGFAAASGNACPVGVTAQVQIGTGT